MAMNNRQLMPIFIANCFYCQLSIAMKPLSFLSALLLGTFVVSAQELPVKMAEKLDSLQTAYPAEKTFLHTDKSKYIAGETVWFKAYVALDGKPTYISRVVYITLTDTRGTIIEKRMLPMKDGAAYGDIVIKKELPSGTYSLQCYTLWMLNFPELVFSKPVFIYNTDYKQPTTASTAKPDFNIQFMPEGGDAVAGVTNRIAFKATGKNGLPVSVQGTVMDSKKNKVANIVTQHDGMGVFEFTPSPDETYTASLKTEAGSLKTATLPAIKKEGIVMQVINNNANRMFVQLQRGEFNKAKYNNLYIVAQLNNEIVYGGQVNFDEGQQAAAINKKTLKPGIIQLTVLLPDGTPLAERLAFISNYENNAPAIVMDTLSTDARRKNQYTLDLSAYKKMNASVSITNFSSDTNRYHSTIISSLLMSSDLKGYIHNPGYYFRDKEANTLQALDLLLMTQGWRRFKWEELLKDQYPPLAWSVESGISIAGTLTTTGGKALEKGRMDFIIRGEDSSKVMSTVYPNAKNQFVIPDLDFRKSATVYYQGTNVNKSDGLTKVTFYPFYFDTLKKQSWAYHADLDPAININALMEKLLAEKLALDKADGKVLGEVVVTAKKLSYQDSLAKAYASDLFMMSDQTIPMDKMTYYSIWQFLQRTVPGINIGKNEFGQTTVFFNRYMNLDPIPTETIEGDPAPDGTTDVTFFLNEVPVSKDLIDGLDPTEVALVKIWKGPSAYVLGAPRGAIAIYTAKGRSGKDWRDKGFDFFRKEGYSVVREFYAADYSVTDPKSSFPDIRETLYWNPSLRANSSGKAKIVFYNDDVAKQFKVSIQGIDDDGKLISIEKVIGGKVF